jgi:CelD/BcsL family acetyltransferase involved in cellulose biosynthesis
VNVRVIETSDEFRRCQSAWDRLWEASDLCLPTLRARPLGLFLETFRLGGGTRILVAEDGTDFVAALPLVLGRRKRVLTVAELPLNPWHVGGDLLVRNDCDVPHVMAALADRLSRYEVHALWLQWIDAQSSRWEQFMAQWRDRQWPVACWPQFEVGLVETTASWDQYWASRSRNLRKQMQRGWSRLADGGPLTFEVLDGQHGESLGELLDQCFTLENGTWKGDRRSSVLSQPGMTQFYRSLARQLADGQMFRLALLKLGDQIVAFDYGFAAKGSWFSFKIGYDTCHARHSPGNLLTWKLIERLHQTPGFSRLDTMGELSPATARWATGSYRRSCCIAATQRRMSPWLVEGYVRLKPRLDAWRAGGSGGADAGQASVGQTGEEASIVDAP